MKIVNVLVVFMLAFFFLSSCQKELNFENVTGLSSGSLKYDTATHECYPSTVNGQYVVDSALTQDNFIDVQVNVIFTGDYTIYSDTVNGYYFRGEGNFGTPGLNTARLYGHGIPDAPAPATSPNPFIIRYGDTSTCIVDVVVLATSVNAVYTFAGAGATCTNSSPAGLYMEGIPTNASNMDTVTVDVTALGNYNMLTTAVNGVTFSASGTFITLGLQTVVLTASGTPTVAGPFTFPLVGGASSCAFSITFDPMAPPSTYVFGGNPGDCTSTAFTGNYQEGSPMNASNTVTVDVTVSVAGSYSITTANNNGVTFSGSGVFTTSGAVQVTLTATGLPAAAGTYDYDLLGGSSSGTCIIHATYSPAVPDIFSCSIDGGSTTDFTFAASAILDNTSTPTQLDLVGGVSISSSEQLYINVQDLTGAAIVAGNTYDVNMPQATTVVAADYMDAAGVDYVSQLDGTTHPAPVFTITISTITTGPGARITGTFSGELRDNNGSGTITRTLTAGVFDLPLQ